MKNKKIKNRIRRTKSTRAKIKRLQVPRLCISKSHKHIYVQLIEPNSANILASASTLDKGLSADLAYGGNIDAAKKVGSLIGSKTIELGIKEVAFDRSGYQYHGRVKALADSAREAGLDF